MTNLQTLSNTTNVDTFVLLGETQCVLRNTKKNIKYIIHTADIHIRRTNERLEEYKQVFANLQSDLNSLDINSDNSLIVICGDIFHDKELLSPQSVELCKEFFNMLSSITNIIVIPGNHDIVENNQNINSLKAVINKYFQSKNKIYYIDENKNYIYNNLILSNTNVFANKVTEYIQTDKYSDKLIIQLYHGIVLGCVNDSNSFLGDDKNFRLSDFRKYNKDGLILLGDIHKYQKLDEHCCYSGSLIQQNRGESINKGYVLWDVENKTSMFRKIKNDYGFVKITIDKDGKINNDINFDELPKFTKLNIISKSTDINHLDNIYKLCDNKKTKIIEKNQYFDMSEHNLNTTLEVNGKQNNMSLTNKIDLTNILLDFIKKDDKTINKSIENKIKILVDNIKFVEISVKNIKLKTLKFTNFMKYGENNVINFENLTEFYAIFAKNSAGKSSLYDCILYSIYGESSRGSAYDLINKDSKYMETEIVLYVNDIEYKITRKISKQSEKNQTIKTDVLNICENNINITYDIRKSSKIIEEKICPYNEFVRNSIVAQHIDVNFMNLSPREKINYLSNISRLEVIKQISNDCNVILKSKKKEYMVKSNELEKYNYYKKNNDDDINTIYSKKYNKKDNKENNMIVDIKKFIEQKIKLHKENKENIIQKIKDNKLNLDTINRNISINEYEITNLYNELNKYKIKNMDINDDIDIDKIFEDKEILENKKFNIESELDKLNDRQLFLYCDMRMKNYEQINRDFNKKQKDKINTINKIISSKQKILWNDITFDINKYDKNRIIENIKKSNVTLNEYNKDINSFKNKLKDLDKIIKQKVNKVVFNINEYNDNILKKEILQDKLLNNNNDLEKLNESYKNMSEYKYDKNCKYCLENNITKQKIFIESMIKDKNNEIKENKINLENSNKYIKSQKEIKDKYDDYINKIDLINNTRNEIEDIKKNIELILMKIYKEESLIKINTDILNKIKLYENNEDINRDIEIEQNKLDEINDMVCTEYEYYLQMNKDYNKIIEEINKLNNELSKINKDITDVNKLIDNYNNYKNDIYNYNLINKQIDKLNDILIKEKNNLDKIKHYIIKKEDELNENLKNINKCIFDRETYNNLFIELEIQNKEIEEYEIINNVICNEDLITKLLKNNIIPQIQTLMNNILLNCASYQIEILYNKDNIEIYKKENGSDTITNIATCGGFERHTLNLLFRIIFSQISGLIRTNYIIIDECFDSSDITNKEKIKNIIEYMKSKYKWGIIISHDVFVKDNFEKEFVIQYKDNKPYVNI